MRPADIFRRTSFRLAVGMSGVVLLLFLVASTVGYAVMRGQMKLRQDARLTEIVASLHDDTLAADKQDLVESVLSRIAASKDRSTVYLLRGPDGAVLAASIRNVAVPPGFSAASGRDLGIGNDLSYRVYAETFDGYSLVVGLSDADLDELAETLAKAFGWTGLCAVLATLLAATLVAWRVQGRIAVVEHTLARVARGDLAARLPVTPRGDDLDQIAHTINRTLARLASQVDAMRQVSDDVAHDLRTPLNRLRIRVEAAAAMYARAQPIGDELAAALTDADTIAQTFSALLRIAQIEAGARRAQFAPLHLAAVIADVAEAYRGVAEDAGMTLATDLAAPAPVTGDRELLTQMFANLVENAIRHCPPGTRIACGTGTEGARATAFVRDTGPGIPEAERGKVLRRLYRLEKSRTTEGSGLGLALVKAVADLHEADLALTDAGPGLCVVLRFPPAPPAP